MIAIMSSLFQNPMLRPTPIGKSVFLYRMVMNKEYPSNNCTCTTQSSTLTFRVGTVFKRYMRAKTCFLCTKQILSRKKLHI